MASLDWLGHIVVSFLGRVDGIGQEVTTCPAMGHILLRMHASGWGGISSAPTGWR